MNKNFEEFDDFDDFDDIDLDGVDADEPEQSGETAEEAAVEPAEPAAESEPAQVAVLTETPEKKPRGKRGDSGERAKGWLVRDVFEWGETIVSAVIIIVVIFTFAARITSVDGHSMEPTLVDRDLMVVTNLFYTPKHNDIVVIHSPTLRNSETNELGRDIIKRVIAVGGDTLRIEPRGGTGLVYLNGEPLELLTVEGVLWEDGHRIADKTYAGELLEITIPEGYVFVMGDNRDYSLDSRSQPTDSYQGYVGLVNVNHIAGRAFFRVMPFSGFGPVK